MFDDLFFSEMLPELKYVADGDTAGTIEGYGAVFGSTDQVGDVILPGAFAATLAQHKAAGTMPEMYADHSAFTGGSKWPIGVWTEMSEDSKGLLVKGQLGPPDTDDYRRAVWQLKNGGKKGLSIAFTTPIGGAVYGKRTGEPKRTLKQLNLHAVDLVSQPAHPSAAVHSLKSLVKSVDAETAVSELGKAIALHRKTMTGGNSPNSDERALMLTHLQTAHHALTGYSMPAGLKTAPATIREFEDWLREEFQFSNTQARAIAEHGFKSASQPRDEGEKAELTAAYAAFGGFSLPSLKD